jgi:hypothetical protein
MASKIHETPIQLSIKSTGVYTKGREEMYYRAMQGTERALGLEHTSTHSMVKNLGVLYKSQDKLDEVKKMY